MRMLPSQQPSQQQKSQSLVQRQQKHRLFALPGWLIALLLGLLVLFGVVPGTGSAGALCALMGAGGCAWELNYWAHQRRERQRVAESARLHIAQKAKRQARQAEQKDTRQQQKATQTQARENQTQQNQAERQIQAERAAQEAAQRLTRFAQVTCEAERLQSLDADAFRAEAERIFAMRRLHLPDEAAPNAVVLRFADGSVTVADVEALETERQQADATRAYLIGRDGFTPPAVRLSQRFPLTLVEPQLLAQWKITTEM